MDCIVRKEEHGRFCAWKRCVCLSALTAFRMHTCSSNMHSMHHTCIVGLVNAQLGQEGAGPIRAGHSEGRHNEEEGMLTWSCRRESCWHV